MPTAPRSRVAARDELAAVWSEVLAVHPEPEDTFTDLGGSSLEVEEVVARSRITMVAPLEAADFRGDPTLDEQVDRVLERHRGGFRARGASTQRLRPGGSPAVFCFAGAGATVAWFLPLLAGLGGAGTGALAVYGLQAHGLQGRARASWGVRGAARRHLRAITAAQSGGPYLLVGHSFGGIVALEVAALLRARGQRVGAVVLLDTVVDADVALRMWSPGQEGFSAGERAARTAPRPLRLAADVLRAAGAGLIRYDPARQKRVFWELGMRAQRRYRIRDCAAVTVLLTEDAPGQAKLWRGLGVPEDRIRHVPGGHLSMVGEAAVHAQVEAILTAAAARSH